MDGSCGSVKLYHPRGPLVTLPVAVGTSPQAAMGEVSALLDAGWLVEAPGMEEGEQKETVGWFVRGEFERDGEVTPYILLYSTNEQLSFSFLKVYLNTPDQVAEFERVSGCKLANLPLYIGQDKPERGKSRQIDRFIVKVARPFGVVLKGNPRYNEDAAKAAKSKNEMYTTPRRVFVRWGDQSSAPSTAPSANGKPVEVIERGPNLEVLDWWKQFFSRSPNVEAVNFRLVDISGHEREDRPTFIAIKHLLAEYAKDLGWDYDRQKKAFVEPVDANDPIPF